MPLIWSSCAGLSGWIVQEKTQKNKTRNRVYSEWEPATFVVTVIILMMIIKILIIKRIQDDEDGDEEVVVVVRNIGGTIIRSWF